MSRQARLDSPVTHSSFLAKGAKKHALSQCRKLLGLNPALPEIPKKSPQDLLRELQKGEKGSSLLLTLSSAPAICSSHGSTLAHRIPRRLLPRHEPGTGSQQHLPR